MVVLSGRCLWIKMLAGPVKSRVMKKGKEKTQSLHHQHAVGVLQGAGGSKDTRHCVLSRHQMGSGGTKRSWKGQRSLHNAELLSKNLSFSASHRCSDYSDTAWVHGLRSENSLQSGSYLEWVTFWGLGTKHPSLLSKPKAALHLISLFVGIWGRLLFFPGSFPLKCLIACFLLLLFAPAFCSCSYSAGRKCCLRGSSKWWDWNSCPIPSTGRFWFDAALPSRDRKSVV